MNFLTSADFIADVERQYKGYAINAGCEVAEHYAAAAEATARVLEQHPQLGPRGSFTHPRLRVWLAVLRSISPFQETRSGLRGGR